MISPDEYLRNMERVTGERLDLAARMMYLEHYAQQAYERLKALEVRA